MISKLKLIIQNYKLSLAIFSIAMILLGLVGLYVSYPKLENVRLIKPGNSVVNINNPPVLVNVSMAGNYLVEGDLKVNKFSQKKLKIIPDNCLQSLYINNQQVDLKLAESELCDFKKGFTLDLSDKLVEGSNTLQFNIKDDGGAMLLLVYPSLEDNIFLIICCLLMLPCLILVALFLMKMKWHNSIILLFLLGIVIRLIYLSYTHFNLRTHDVDGHIDYINFLLDKGALPDSKACWQCYQPPIYYTFTAGLIYLWQFFKLDFIFDSYFILQLISLVFYLIFSFFGIQIFRTIFSDNRQAASLIFSASSMFIFWPAGIIHSVRIGNDLLLYALYTAGLYYLIKWWQKNDSRELYIASILSVVAVLTKSSGAVLVLIICLCLVFRFWLNRLSLKTSFDKLIESFKINKDFKSRKKEILEKMKTDFIYITEIIISGIIFVFGGMAIFAKAVYAGDKELIGNSGSLNSALAVGNNLENYLFFDLKDFLNTPFASPWRDEGGRQYFLNYFFKTSLFGEFQIENLLNKNLAILFSFLFIVAILVVGWGFLTMTLDKLEKQLPLIINLIILPLSLAYVRVSYPFSPSNDFRYVLPFLISFIVLYFISINNFLKPTIIKYFLIILPVIFAILSLVFFLVPISSLPQIY
jgi:hypothetical protein